MKHYDVITIGAGGGAKLMRPIADLGYRVAAIEKGPMGGTCLNRGCIPSKMLIHPADVAETIRSSGEFFLSTDRNISVDFPALIDHVSRAVDADAESIRTRYEAHPNIELYQGEARFVGEKIISVHGETLTADKIYLAVGARPMIPPIEGLVGTPFLTSSEALRLREQPKSMIVIGGGYIGVELGHFFRALGTKVTFVVRDGLITNEDDDIREAFSALFPRKDVLLDTQVTKVEYRDATFRVHIEDASGTSAFLEAEALLVATGVTPNSDTLSLEQTGVQTDGRGYITVNEYLETTAPGIYALGDVTGKYLFRHAVNFEAEYLLRTHVTKPSREPIVYPPMPHAIFSSPQVAGVGVKERDLILEGKVAGVDYIVGKNTYTASAMGMALRSPNTEICKLIFELPSTKLIGAHIIGHEASTMIHMPIAYMNMNATLEDMLRTIYIHPALPEIVRNAARNAKTAMSGSQV